MADIDKIRNIIVSPMTAAVLEAVEDVMERQTWYQRYANTVNATAGMIATGGAALLLSGLDLPGWAVLLVTGVVAVAGAFAVKSTKNGITPSILAKIASPATVELAASKVAVAMASPGATSTGDLPYGTRYRTDES